eukprot:g61435.t1
MHASQEANRALGKQLAHVKTCSFTIIFSAEQGTWTETITAAGFGRGTGILFGNSLYQHIGYVLTPFNERLQAWLLHCAERLVGRSEHCGEPTEESPHTAKPKVRSRRH